MEMMTDGSGQQYPIEKTIYQCEATKRAFYRVKLPKLGLYYGLKEIAVKETRAIKAIKNEIVALNRLPFGIAARCHQYWQQGNKHYLLMDWIEGIPLNEYAGSAPVSRQDFAQRVKVAEKVGKKLAELHRYSVTHRDLKPENVVIHTDRNGNVRDVSLIDFGLSNQKRHFEEGTAHYRSPEQEFMRNTNLTLSSDVFSFSQLVHFLLVGEPLMLQPNFEGSDWDELTLVLPDFTPMNLKNTLQQGLQFDAQKRIKAVFPLVKALQEASRKLEGRR